MKDNDAAIDREADGAPASKGPRRFYTEALARPDTDGFVVTLDGRPARTPGRSALRHRSRALVEAAAAEWAAQGETIVPASMPLTRLLSTCVDLGERESGAWRTRILGFLATDALCYRADRPADLVVEQRAAWNPFLDWFSMEFGSRLVAARGIIAVGQPADTIEAAQSALGTAGAETTLGIRIVAEATGSGVLALARWRSGFGHDAIFAASRVDEEHQIAKWGRDAEADARLALIRADYDAGGRLIDLAKQ